MFVAPFISKAVCCVGLPTIVGVSKPPVAILFPSSLKAGKHSTREAKRPLLGALSVANSRPAATYPQSHCVAFGESQQTSAATNLRWHTFCTNRSQLTFRRLAGYIPKLHSFVYDSRDEQMPVRSEGRSTLWIPRPCHPELFYPAELATGCEIQKVTSVPSSVETLAS